ncbi:hypothetical protein BT96DRAFT_1033438, partial [Gymnopus androsaceus JB14]
HYCTSLPYRFSPPPPTKLGVHRVISPNLGVHVSPFCLGAMSVDASETSGMGSYKESLSFKLLDAYFDMGSNFIDTADNYQYETSEQFIGEYPDGKRGIRDQIVGCDKDEQSPKLLEYTTNFKRDNDSIGQKANYTGNDTNSMHVSVENVINHSFERDIHPLARSLGLAPAPWGVVLVGGKIRIDAEERTAKRVRQGDWQRTETEVSRALEKVAGEVGNITAVVIACVMSVSCTKRPTSFPSLEAEKANVMHQ